MTIGAIWAQAHDRVIGDGSSIPWHIPEDLAHFKKVTLGATVVMGRRTWDSLPVRFRPLPGRRNIVLTTDRTWRAEGAEPAYSLDAALEADGDIWVIGGGEIYALAMPVVEQLEVTEVDLQAAGRTRAPLIDEHWELHGTDPQAGWHTSANGPRFRWLTYRRRLPSCS